MERGYLANKTVERGYLVNKTVERGFRPSCTWRGCRRRRHPRRRPRRPRRSISRNWKEELWASAADKHEHEELRCVELKEDVAAALDRLEKETGASVVPYARAVVEWYGARLFAEFGSDVDNDSKTNSGSLAGPRVLERESRE